MEHFRLGWDHRPAANAAACALELAWNHAVRGDIEPIRDLLDEADAFFKSVGSVRDAESFYNRMAVLASAAPALAPFAEEVHDRAVAGPGAPPPLPGRAGVPGGGRGLGPLRRAVALDAGVHPRRPVRRELGRPLALHRDATDRRDLRLQGIQVGRGMVTAACQAGATSELFLGFADGKILAFRPGRNQVVPVGEVHGAVVSIAADLDGQIVVALHSDENGTSLAGFLRQPDGSFRRRPDSVFPAYSPCWLTPIHRLDGESLALIGLGDGQDLLILDAVSGLPRGRVSLAAARSPPPRRCSSPALSPSACSPTTARDGLLDDQGHDPSAGRIPCGGRSAAVGNLRCAVPLAWILPRRTDQPDRPG